MKNLSEQQIQTIKKECVINYSLSSGPGGQNVNKNSTKATLHWSLQTTKLSEKIKSILFFKLKNKITVKHELVVSSQTSRTQSTNVKNCYQKLLKIIDTALQKPKKRVPTKPTKGSIERRIEFKKKESEKKKNRKKINF